MNQPPLETLRPEETRSECGMHTCDSDPGESEARVISLMPARLQQYPVSKTKQNNGWAEKR